MRLARRLVQEEKGYARDRLFRWGFSAERTKLPGCHSNWPDGEQSGLLRGICQHGAAVTGATEARLALRFPLGRRERGSPTGEVVATGGGGS